MSLQKLLGIELPIIQAPMAGVQAGALAVAVSERGRARLAAVRDAESRGDAPRSCATIQAQPRAPFNVNFFCHTPPAPSARARSGVARGAGALLPGVRHRPGLDSRRARARAFQRRGRRRARANSSRPSSAFISACRRRNCSPACGRGARRSSSSATTVDEARWLEAQGVDAVIAQGVEAGGHRGMFLSDDLTTQVGTFALLPQVVRAVNVPVIAAGGIADARGVAAAMALGAAGVAGRHGLSAVPGSDDQRRAPRGAQERGRPPHRADQPLHRPARARHRQSHHARAGPDQRGGARISAGGLRHRAAARARPKRQGSGDFSPLWSGQNASGCREIPAARAHARIGRGPVIIR